MMKSLVPFALIMCTPLFSASVYTDYGDWSTAALAPPNMAVEYIDGQSFTNDNMGQSRDAAFQQGADQTHDGSWSGDAWTYNQAMYGFAMDLNIDPSQAQLLGVSNGVADLYLPSAFESNPESFVGFTSSTPFTSVALTLGPDSPIGDPPFPSADYNYQVRDQFVAYDPPATAPEPSSLWLVLASLPLLFWRFISHRSTAACSACAAVTFRRKTDKCVSCGHRCCNACLQEDYSTGWSRDLTCTACLSRNV